MDLEQYQYMHMCSLGAALPNVLVYANSKRNAAYVLEIKNHLRLEELERLRHILEKFSYFIPEYADKELDGILAVVDAPKDLRQKALSVGIFMAGINDEQFKLEVPENFQPKAW